MKAGRPPAQYTATLDRLRAAVREGRFDAGGLLPGERHLSTEFAVSRTTLRRVLETLVEEGVLAHRHGVGTFVATALASVAAPAREEPARVGGFTEAMRRHGRIPSTRDVSHAVVEPTADQAMLLACSPREAVVRLRRLRCADGEPVMVEETVVPRAFCPEPAAFVGSLHAALADRGWPAVRALQRVQAALASASEANQLQVPVASPLVLLRRADYLADGRCCLVTDARVRPDRFDLLIEFGSAAQPVLDRTLPERVERNA